jgi:hypothetical protein
VRCYFVAVMMASLPIEATRTDVLSMAHLHACCAATGAMLQKNDWHWME